MKKILTRYFLLFILIFLGIFGLQSVLTGIFIAENNQGPLIIVGSVLVGIDVLYYFFIYKRFYPIQ